MSLTDESKAIRGRLILANSRKLVVDWMSDADTMLEKFEKAMTSPTTCEHNFQFQGVVYKSGRQLPGSGACARHYFDRYYCTKCLTTADRNEREHGNDYGKALDGTVPA